MVILITFLLAKFCLPILFIKIFIYQVALIRRQATTKLLSVAASIFYGILLDLAKVFDCVNHLLLQGKLEHHGVKKNAYFINAYLNKLLIL